MIRTLHILNGDSTATLFSESSLEGDFLVWREMLCEGAIYKDVGSDTFWRKRYAFFEKEMGISRLDYFDKTIKELVKIEDLSEYRDVVLWFEYDLFCQINLLALCTYLLKHYKKNIHYYLVCVGEDKNKEGMQTLSDYSPKEYQNLYAIKVKITRNDLQFAALCWEKYVANDLKELKQFDFNQNKKFTYLQIAINQHLLRLPYQKELGQIELKILNIINVEKVTKDTILKKLLLWQQKETVYGFGDTQYVLYLERLKDYYLVKDEYFTLNEKGKALIK